MKKTFLLLFTWLTAITLYAQQDKTPKYSTYYYQRASLFESLPVTSEDIIFIGNSITDGGEWYELFNNPHVKNRGISGDTTQGVFDRLDAIIKGKPAKIFLMIGINNVPQNESADDIAAGIRRIVQKIKQVSPETQVYVQSLLPVTTYYNMFQGHTSQWKRIPEINQKIQEITEEEQVQYIDLFSHFVDSDGQMQKQYTNDGLHLLGKGYLLWKEIITPYL